MALRGVTAALVQHQGYKLAQIVTETHAPDLAVGDVGAEEVVAGGDDDDVTNVFGSVHHHRVDDANLIAN